MTFSSETKTLTLLWCDRHCCLCKKACGVNIEVHHIVPESKEGRDDIDNAIPLCFECHSEVLRYNNEHPMGNKYKSEELKPRRDQVHEEFTRHLVPPVNFQITQSFSEKEKRTFPNVGFLIHHLGDSLPIKARVTITSVLESGEHKINSEFYSGKNIWNLNPRMMFSGHFKLDSQFIPNTRQLELRVRVSIIDQFGREHFLLPVGFVYVQEGNFWYAEP